MNHTKFNNIKRQLKIWYLLIRLYICISDTLDVLIRIASTDYSDFNNI